MQWKMMDVITAWLLIAAGLVLGLTVVDVDVAARLQLDDLPKKLAFGLMGAAALYQFLQFRAIRRRIRG